MAGASLQGLYYGAAASIAALPAVGVAEGAGAVVPGIGVVPGATILTAAGAAGTMYGAAKFSAELEAGNAFEEFLAMKDEHGQPMEKDVARAAALAVGGLNGALEVVGLEVLAQSIPGIKTLKGALSRRAVREALKSPTIRAALGAAVKSYGGTLAKEAAVEVTQRAITIMGGELGKAAGMAAPVYRTAGDVWADLTREFLGSVQSFGLTVLPGPLIQIAQQARQVQAARNNEAFFYRAREGATNSKTLARAPEAVRDLITRATKDGPIQNVFIPSDTFQTYWQSKGQDPAVIAQRLGIARDAYEQAVTLRQDLAVPTATYATTLAATEHHSFFARELRLHPHDMNAREADAFEATLAAQPPAAPLAPGPAAEVHAQLVAAAVRDLGLTPAVAEKYATLHEAAFGTLGARALEDPVATFKCDGPAARAARRDAGAGAGARGRADRRGRGDRAGGDPRPVHWDGNLLGL
jgi:hypothetical protein